MGVGPAVGPPPTAGSPVVDAPPAASVASGSAALLVDDRLLVEVAVVDDAVVDDAVEVDSAPAPHVARATAMRATMGSVRGGMLHVRSTVPDVRTPTCVWRIRPELIVALDERFGEPIDAYVNGSQVWLRDLSAESTNADGVTIEWRLHPVAGFRRPPDIGTYELFETVALALGTERTPPALPESLWDGLEAYPAHGDDMEPTTLVAHCTDALGLAPDVSGLVDHGPIADEWERSRGGISIIARVFEQLAP